MRENHNISNKCQRCGNKVNSKGLQLGDTEWIHEKCYNEVLRERVFNH